MLRRTSSTDGKDRCSAAGLCGDIGAGGTYFCRIIRMRALPFIMLLVASVTTWCLRSRGGARRNLRSQVLSLPKVTSRAVECTIYASCGSDLLPSGRPPGGQCSHQARVHPSRWICSCFVQAEHSVTMLTNVVVLQSSLRLLWLPCIDRHSLATTLARRSCSTSRSRRSSCTTGSSI